MCFAVTFTTYGSGLNSVLSLTHVHDLCLLFTSLNHSFISFSIKEENALIDAHGYVSYIRAHATLLSVGIYALLLVSSLHET